MGNCYKITIEPNTENMLNHWRKFFLNFNETISDDELPLTNIYVTSENNAYGVVANTWMDGKLMDIKLEKNLFKGINLTPIQYNYLKANSKCGNESFHECLSKHLAKNFENSATKCSTVSLPYWPVCKVDNENSTKFLESFQNIWKKIVNDKICE